MLQTIRDRATGWIAYVIVALLVIPFALWGVNSYFTDAPLVDVAKVGDRTISIQEFQLAYQRHRQRLQSMLGNNFDPSMFNEAQMRFDVLQQLVNEQVLVQTAYNKDLTISDQQLGSEVLATDVFRTDGVFDPQRYQQYISVQGYTPASFEAALKESMLAQQLRQGIAASVLLSSADEERYLKLTEQQRNVSYLELHSDDYLQEDLVDDETIQNYYDNNQDRYLTPEQTRIRFIDLSLDDLAEQIVITDEALEAAYAERQEQYRRPEEREASYILFRTNPDMSDEEREAVETLAQALYESLVSGEQDFDAAVTNAQESNPGQEAGSLGAISPGMMSETFEAALFDLEEVGAISEPVATDFGYQIVRLDNIIPEAVQSLDEVSDELAADLRRQRAEPEFYEAVETLTNLSYENPQSLEVAADALGVDIQESDWFSREGDDSEITSNAEVIDAAFDSEVLDVGYNSPPIELSPEQVVVLRNLDHQPSQPQELAAVKDTIITEIRKERARERLEAALNELEAELQQGRSLAEVAADSLGELKEPGLVGRNSGTVPSPIRSEAFQLPVPAEGESNFGKIVLDPDRRAIVVIDDVVLGDVAAVPDNQRQSLVQQLENQLGAAQFEHFLDSQRREIEVETYSERL